MLKTCPPMTSTERVRQFRQRRGLTKPPQMLCRFAGIPHRHEVPGGKPMAQVPPQSVAQPPAAPPEVAALPPEVAAPPAPVPPTRAQAPSRDLENAADDRGPVLARIGPDGVSHAA